MRPIIILFLLIIFFASSLQNVSAQKTPVKKDSLKVYKNIQKFSEKRKFTKFLYRLVFRPVATTPVVVKKTRKKIQQTKYIKYEGKIIRNINIMTIDPFGYTLTDTLVSSQYFLPKIGNKLHVSTLSVTVRNLLIIKRNGEFDSLQVKESERLVRSQRYVHDVLFSFEKPHPNSDSVDVYIRVLDEWSIIPSGAFSSTHINIELNEKNLAGLGHNIDASYNHNQSNGRQSGTASYLIPNFRNTYISSLINYHIDEQNNYLSSIDIERPFYSPLVKWAGGLYFSRQLLKKNLIKNDSSTLMFMSRVNTIDIWGAESWQIFKGNTIDRRTTKLILSARVFSIHFLDKPPTRFDTLNNYTDENLYLTGLGISTREYVKDKYVFRFGVTEDIPVGRTYGVVAGYQLRDSKRLYWGVRYSRGNYYPFGYLSENLEYGEFVNTGKSQEGAFNADITYFTGLFEFDGWKLRQFIKPEVTIGIKRYISDSLTLHENRGISGFNSNGLTGTQRIILKFQTQSYAPWNLLGFRFGPYFIFSLGILGNEQSGFRYSRVYTQIGLGTLIRNDYWVLSTFQLSFAFYPSIPGNGINIFRTDKFKTTDFGLMDFDLGRPDIVNFR